MQYPLKTSIDKFLYIFYKKQLTIIKYTGNLTPVWLKLVSSLLFSYKAILHPRVFLLKGELKATICFPVVFTFSKMQTPWTFNKDKRLVIETGTNNIHIVVL